MIRFTCAQCQSAMEVPEEHGGRSISCPRCGHVQFVPSLLPVQSSTPPFGRLVRGIRSFRVPRLAPWGYLSPSVLVLAVFLFALPWVQIRCDRPIENSDTRTLVEQSGFQAVYGGYSQNPALETARTERTRQQRTPQPDEDRDPVSAAPLMLLSIALVVAGIVLWFKTRGPLLRPAAVAACSGAALFVLLVQLGRGFPLERAMNAPAIRTMTTQAAVFGAIGASGLVEVHYTPWFWLTVFLVGASLIAALIDCWLVVQPNAGRRHGAR
jgi:DNA-directed RNA polymerase subunit RPC12/RpoP